MRQASILLGHALDRLREVPDNYVQCVVTSPPYWGLRDYKIASQVWGGDPTCAHDFALESVATEVGKGNWTQGVNGRGEAQPGGVEAKREPLRATVETGFCGLCGAWLGSFGLEPTPELYVAHAVAIFREVRRVLRADGTCWLNIGDSYANDGKWGGETGGKQSYLDDNNRKRVGRDKRLTGLKPKDRVMIPFRLALALQADGWWVRQDIIWSKKNPMPESVRDRCTKAHEYIFLLTKSAKYYFDQEAILEPVSVNTHARLSQDVENQIGSERANGGQKTNGNMKAVARSYKGSVPGRSGGPGQDRRGDGGREGHKLAEVGSGIKSNEDFSDKVCCLVDKRNKRSVWEIGTEPFSEAHFATFPTELVRPCILAGSSEGDLVMDPFSGSGTTGLVALRHNRRYLGIELNPDYLEMSRRRIVEDAPLLTEFTAFKSGEVYKPTGKGACNSKLA
ncbi:MAG TPA: site-specific DNA-methyltransferase [Gammaproteobacteria bacterium]|nr:site-specific DNA-methyltransferase [Gammaproteobacteria bacterium]